MTERRGRGADRALRDLVGAGPSQLGVSKALRGRDVNRPTDDEVAEAERDVTVVRRHWRPPDAHGQHGEPGQHANRRRSR